jgi:hypothetical protein
MANSIDILINARDKASGVMDKVEGRAKKLSGSLKRMRLPLMALAGGLAAVGTASVMAASDLEESINMSNEVFKESSGVIKKWAEENALGFGISNKNAFEYAGNLGGIMKASGFVAEEAAHMSIQMMELAGDMASFKNIRVEDALLKIQAGLTGETEPLKRVGVLMNEAIIKERAYKMGLELTNGKLTESQKVQARFAEIMSQTVDMQGDAARTSDTFAGALREFKAASANAAAEMGKELLPAMTGVMNVVRDATIGFSKLPDPMKKGAVAAGVILAAIALLGLAIPPLVAGFGALGVAATLALGPLGLLALALAAVGVAAFTVFDQARSATNEFERLRAEAEELGIEGARTIKNYDVLAMKVQNVKLAQDKLNRSVAEHKELADDILATTGGIGFVMEKNNKQARLFSDNLEAHVELAEEFKRVKQQTREAEEAAERSKIAGPSLGLARRRDPQADKWKKGGAAATWWEAARGKPGGPTAEEQAIFEQGTKFPVGDFGAPDASWQDPETGMWNRVSIDPKTGQTKVYRQENAVEVTSVLDGVQVGTSMGDNVAKDQANKSG